MLAPIADTRIVGYVEAGGSRYRRTRHKAYLVIGALRSYQAAASGVRPWTHCGVGERLRNHPPWADSTSRSPSGPQAV